MDFEKVCQSAEYVKSRIKKVPSIAMVLGSGLGGVVEVLENKVIIPYGEIPYFPVSTVSGHEGNLLIGDFGNLTVAILQGRVHYYEGLGMEATVYPVYVLKQIGVEKLILTNACGGINRSFVSGDLMLITDFINFMGCNPLIGPNDERFGPRFPDMSDPFALNFREQAMQAAAKEDISYQEGVYAFFTGPCYETAAEIRAFAVLGADAVGMSTVPETIAANYLGMEVLGIACITNMATGIRKDKHSHEEVLRIAGESNEKLSRWIRRLLIQLG